MKVEFSKYEKKVFDSLTEPKHAYELKLVCDDNVEGSNISYEIVGKWIDMAK